MPPRIIVADPDQGFGLMLTQMLEMDNAYVADYAPNGSQALHLAREKNPQLVIIDAALADITPLALVRALRQQSPGLRIMLIPLDGKLPSDYVELNLQGTLPKPFFAGDLGTCIARALYDMPGPSGPNFAALSPLNLPAAAPRNNGTDNKANGTVPLKTPATPPPALSPTNPPAPRVRSASQTPRPPACPAPAAEVRPEPTVWAMDGLLDRLASEISADALFVVKPGGVIAQRSNMSELRQEAMAELMADWSKVAAAMAAFVGERGSRFKQLHFEGERYHIYGFAITDSAMIVAICRSDVAFGSLRLSIKSAGPAIARHLA